MTDIEEKALALWGPGVTAEVNLHNFSILGTAFLEMRERHEAFRQEVSDAIQALKKDVGTGWDHCRPAYACNRFIIAKPDPLVEAVKDCQFASLDAIEDYVAKKLREALAKRGGKIVWREGH
jgi:hypothetical protein